MQEQLKQNIGQVIALHTEKGMEIGILQAVTADGVVLKSVPKKERQEVQAEQVYWGGGFYPWRRFGGFGFGYPGMGFGYGGFGYGGLGYGGFGFGYRPFFW